MGLPIDKAGFQSSASNRVEKFSLAAGRIVYLPSWVVGKERARLLHSASGTNNENVSLRAVSKAWECEGKVRHSRTQCIMLYSDIKILLQCWSTSIAVSFGRDVRVLVLSCV